MPVSLTKYKTKKWRGVQNLYLPLYKTLKNFGKLCDFRTYKL